MLSYPDFDDKTMRGMVVITMRGMQAIEDLNTARRHPILIPGKVTCEFSGTKYWRVACTSGMQNMVEFFVNKENGDVYKGSWVRPESKEARFNISTMEGRARLFTHMERSRHGYMYKDRIEATDKALGLTNVG